MIVFVLVCARDPFHDYVCVCRGMEVFLAFVVYQTIGSFTPVILLKILRMVDLFLKGSCRLEDSIRRMKQGAERANA